MATSTQSLPARSTPTRIEGYPVGSIRFDWLFTLFCAWVVGGLYIDGWAHSNGRVDDSFFTPWHALLYAGVGTIGVFLFVNQWRNMNKGYALFRALPMGYLTSLIGAGLFMVGGAFDLVWHETFGFEVDLETLLSPAHLILATSGFLMVTGPIRAAWARYQAGARLSLISAGPTLINAALVLAVLAFFTEFVSPFSHTYFVTDRGGANDTVYSDLYTMNADGARQTRLTNATGASYWGGIWSPDGAQILTSKYNPAASDEGSDLFLLDATTLAETPITTLPGGEYLPTWVAFADGARVAFVNDVDGQRELFWIEVGADGSFGAARQLTDTPNVQEYAPQWSPGGTQLLYIADDTIHVLNMNGISEPDGSAGRTLGSGFSAAWSPDGTQIVYQARNGDSDDIFVMNVDGTNARAIVTSTAWDVEPSWSADGTRILFKSWRTGFGDIFALDTACLSAPETCEATVRNLTHSPVLDSYFPSIASDGQILFTGSSRSGSNAGRYELQSLIIAGVLIHSTMLMLIVLLLIRRWRLPFGSMTVLFALPVALLTVLDENYAIALIGVGGGLIADVLLVLLRPSLERRTAWYLFAAAAPAGLFAIYFLGLEWLGAGITWTIHLWLGALAFAAIAGLFVAFGYLPPFGGMREEQAIRAS